MTNVFDHWQAQKPALRAALEEQTDPAGAADRVRHALLQTEQNALAEMTDEVLRQQAGVLMSQLKTSVDLVDCQTSAQVWTPRRQAVSYTHLFYIEFSSRKTADVLAEETGAKELLFHSCHNVSAEELDAGATYLSLMWHNVAALKEALD